MLLVAASALPARAGRQQHHSHQVGRQPTFLMNVLQELLLERLRIRLSSARSARFTAGSVRLAFCASAATTCRLARWGRLLTGANATLC
jgi:hypothetical protein